MTRAPFRKGDRVTYPPGSHGSRGRVGTVTRAPSSHRPMEVHWDGLGRSDMYWRELIPHRSGSLSGWAQLAYAILWSVLLLGGATVILLIARAMI